MDPSKIVCWNVRGLNGSARQDVVRCLVDSVKADVVCLQETKMSVFSRLFVFRLLGSEFQNFVFTPSVGASGGILVAWKNNISSCGSRIDDHCVSVNLSLETWSSWWLSCVYAPQGNHEKIQFLQDLRLIRTHCSGPWLVVGDFNMILSDEDKSNSNVDRAMMGRFRRWKDDLALLELPLIGRRFTWSNGHACPTLVRLDMMFCTADWEDLFPDCLLQSAATQDSDHCPLLLGLHDINKRKGRFHFQAFWVKLEGFQDVVANTWSSIPAGQCPLVSLSKKLHATAKALQRWSDNKVGGLKLQLEMAQELLHRLEMAHDSRTLSPSEDWLRRTLKKHILVLSSLSRSIARLRSRINWLKEGDTHTSLFHAQARFRKKKNFIGSLSTSEGLILTSHEDKADALFHFYDGLLGTALGRENSLNLDALGMPSFNLNEVDVPFSEEEVWDTVKSMPSDKAPGSDGFTGRLYKACWVTIKADVMAAISCVWARKFRNMGLLNSAFITLLPKVEGAAQVKDFRPISLVHSFAKLVTKMMANRLARHLNDMVSPNQTTFIKKKVYLRQFHASATHCKVSSSSKASPHSFQTRHI
jgi:exonuclease III